MRSLPKILLAFIFLVSAPVFAAIPFVSAPNLPIGASPNAVALGDFNGDGKLDIATGNFENSVTVSLGNGDGTFRKFETSPLSTPVIGLAVADFNGDGKLDLAVNELEIGMIGIMLGNGDGSFQAPINRDGTPEQIIAADFNGDGVPDVAAIGAEGKRETGAMMLGNGDGTLRPPLVFPLSLSPDFFVAGDFDGDGKLDLVVNYGLNYLDILLGNGDGTFQPAQRETFEPDFFSMVAGDFNGDGKLDLAASINNFSCGTSSCPGVVAFLLGNGDGTFQTPAETTIKPIASSDLVSLAAADFDRNGTLDLAVSDLVTNDVSVAYNDGTGAFPTQVSSVVGQYPLSIAVGDLNGDGKPDIVSANELADSVTLLVQDNAGFVAARDYPMPYPLGVAAADFNGDGHPDMVVAQNLANQVVIMLGDGSGTFGQPTGFAVDQNPMAVAAADLNHDGKADVVTANNTFATITVLLGNGDGTLRPGVNYSLPASPSQLSLIDVNGDGNLDAVTSSAVFLGGNYSLSVLLGKGDGTFQTALNTTLAQPPESFAMGDLNGDGKLDIVVGFNRSGQKNLAVLLGNGDGTFQAPVPLSSGPAPSGVTLADLNGDGKVDLVVGIPTKNLISVYLGNGDGTFGKTKDYVAKGFSPSNIAAFDFDGDGIPDLAVSNFYGNTFSLFHGKGDGTFAAVVQVPSLTGSGPMALADFNGDGMTDVALTSPYYGQAVTVFLNSRKP
jgi:hypothetical protein